MLLPVPNHSSLTALLIRINLSVLLSAVILGQISYFIGLKNFEKLNCWPTGNVKNPTDYLLEILLFGHIHTAFAIMAYVFIIDFCFWYNIINF